MDSSKMFSNDNTVIENAGSLKDKTILTGPNTMDMTEIYGGAQQDETVMVSKN